MALDLDEADFLIPPNNPTGRQWWQGRLLAILSALLTLDDAVQTTIEGLGEDATEQALALVANSVDPVLTQLHQDMAAITAEIAAAQDALVAIQAGGIQAVNVTIAEVDGLEAETAQAAVAELATGLAALRTEAMRLSLMA